MALPEKDLVRGCSYLSHGIQAGGIQGVFHDGWKLTLADRSRVGDLLSLLSI
jgi:hypothetical protein